MMRATLIVMLALSACGLAPTARARECITDMECGSGNVCFPDGCGDPGQNIVVEVTGDNTNLHPQDFALSSKAAITNLDVRGPLTLSGLLRRAASDHGAPLEYRDGVTITANGKSDLIPGLNRSYQLVLPRADQAAYQMFVGSGTYTVTARSSDTSIPYLRQLVSTAPGTISGASFTFSAPNEPLIFTGKLVRSTTPLVTTVQGMTIQAFDAIGGAPLSQPTVVTSMGDFLMYVDQSAALLSSITLVAGPKDNTVLVPTKTFVISPVPVLQPSLGTLELGDYGDELVGVTGTIESSTGAPIVKAVVTFEGKVTGEGQFKTRPVVTDAEGKFTVNLLASAAGSPYTMKVVPPSDSTSGITTHLVRATLLEGKPALVIGTSAATRFASPDRLTVSGSVYSPNGDPAVGVTVQATAIEPLDAVRPIPTETATTVTMADGTFQLVLDPARYRIDYIPAVDLPRKSRVVRVEGAYSPDAGSLLQTSDLGSFALSVGRTISGNVTVRPNTLDPQNLEDGGVSDGGVIYVPQGVAAPNALVRFYRVTTVEGVPSSLLIGEGYTDETGRYSVVLPDNQ